MSGMLAAAESAGIGFPVFLTAYDPSDLPGGSLDPLGFERGYLFLADKILPGLTNVADRPRYFSVLCAGASLAEVTGGDLYGGAGRGDPPDLRSPRKRERNGSNMRAEYDFSKGKRGAVIPHRGKPRISIFINNTVLEEFQARAERSGTGYQTMINGALRKSLAETDRPVTEKVLRQVLRQEMPEYLRGLIG